MKKPTAKGWLAIIGAAVAVILAVLAALADGTFTPEEAETVTDKTGVLIETIQQETADEVAP